MKRHPSFSPSRGVPLASITRLVVGPNLVSVALHEKAARRRTWVLGADQSDSVTVSRLERWLVSGAIVEVHRNGSIFDLVQPHSGQRVSRLLQRAEAVGVFF